jgi:hypothetical protein
MIDQNNRQLFSGKLTKGFVVLLFLAVLIKVFMIQYGLPFQTHVDESMILRDPFKILITYSEGDFSKSTNLYNWMLLAWFAVVFVIGVTFGKWNGLGDFKMFLISDSPDFTLYGRVFSLCISMLGIYFLLKLVCEITTNRLLRWMFALMIVLNPVEINSVNWVKFDAATLLPISLILLLSHRYFICGQVEYRKKLYLVMILATTVRIDMCAFLLGIGFFDFFIHHNIKSFRHSFVQVFPVLLIGVVLYSLITLAPFSYLYSNFASSTANALNTSPTFEKAIVSKLSITGNLVNLLLDSGFYVKCLFALLGPFVLLMFIFRINFRAYGFIIFPTIILVCVLIVFPVKNTHYLLTVSIVILYGSFLTIASWGNVKQQVAISVFSVFWIASFTLNQLFVLGRYGDIRLEARRYILQNSDPQDTIYVDGIFSQIFDKKSRYAIRAEAAKQAGSTGLGNEYLSETLNDDETRVVKLVSDWHPFNLPAYDSLFVNSYDTSMLVADSPAFYVFVGPGLYKTSLQDGSNYKQFENFYLFLNAHYKMHRAYLYQTVDPRLKFANYYYFHPVILYQKRV